MFTLNDKLRRLIEKCDRETVAHCLRVAKLAVQFGKRMGLTKMECGVLYLGAMVHDVGKQCIPQTILRKEGPLSTEEMNVVKTHPHEGYALLKEAEAGLAEDVLHMTLYHHERIDGNGYPYGLNGNKIPKMARLLAIIDAYDSMTQDRVYRKALSRKEALTEIEKNMGTQFDEQFGRAFLQMYDSIKR